MRSILVRVCDTSILQIVCVQCFSVCLCTIYITVCATYILQCVCAVSLCVSVHDPFPGCARKCVFDPYSGSNLSNEGHIICSSSVRAQTQFISW